MSHPPDSPARPLASRARLAATAIENQRIQRALHDGVQQDLIALAVQLQLARRLVGSDGQAAVELLEEMRRDAHEALHRIQALADEIYPAVLDVRGLPDALAAAAAAIGVRVSVEANDLGRQAADVELTLYLCGQVALENVAAHAGVGARATIRLREDASAIYLEVADNGVGFDPTARLPTGGLATARDRVEAMNGRLIVRSEPGHGTCVEVTVAF